MLDDTALQRCLNSAYRYLSYRARSEAELRKYLHRRGFGDEVVDRTISKLKEQGLIDDLAFAQSWRDSRLSSKPRSKSLIARELKDKNVARETIEQVIEGINDEDSAYRLGCRHLHVLAHLPYPDFQRRLSNYLAYRGFSYGIIRETVARLWQENKSKT